MIKNTILFLAVLMVIALVSTGCGNKYIDNDVLEQEFENAPQWVLPGHEQGLFSAVGSAVIGKSGMQFAKNAALAQARNELARQLSVKTESLVNNFVLETGLGDDQLVDRIGRQVSRQVTQETLSGSRQKDVWISPGSEIYVLVFMENNAVKQAVRDNVISSYENDQALWQSFKAKNGDADLDREIEKTFGK